MCTLYDSDNTQKLFDFINLHDNIKFTVEHALNIFPFLDVMIFPFLKFNL